MTRLQAKPIYVLSHHTRPGAAFRQASLDILDDHVVFRHRDALDKRRSVARGYFCSRNRRLFVNRFRNKRRRLERFWKHTEFARYLLERLLLVGPVQGGVIEAGHDGGFDYLEIGRDVEVA